MYGILWLILYLWCISVLGFFGVISIIFRFLCGVIMLKCMFRLCVNNSIVFCFMFGVSMFL